MEKTEKLAEEARRERKHLSEEQRAKISELEKEYEAKVAEKEVMMQQAIREAMKAYTPGETEAHIEGLKEKFNAEKQNLLEEKQKKIEAISGEKKE
ncbi:MAG: hypothetical protein ACE5LX_01105 [Nitrospinota bacterium]